MKTIAEDIRFWAARKAKAETLPPHILERHRETYKAVCARLQTLMDTMLRDAIAVIDTALDARRVNAAAEVMQACIKQDGMALADAVQKYNAAGYTPLGFMEVSSAELPTEWRSNVRNESISQQR